MISSASASSARIALERLEHRLLFALERAGGDDDRADRADAEIADSTRWCTSRSRRIGARARVGAAEVERVELQPAGDDDAVAIGAHLDDAARRLLALHAEAIDVGEHAAEERPRQPVARIRPRRDPAVDERRLDAVAAAGAQQVRPDLGFHHDEQPRLHQPQRPVDDEAEVERKVEHLVDVLAGCSAPPAARSSSSSTGRGAAAGSARAAAAAAPAR